MNRAQNPPPNQDWEKSLNTIQFPGSEAIPTEARSIDGDVLPSRPEQPSRKPGLNLFQSTKSKTPESSSPRSHNGWFDSRLPYCLLAVTIANLIIVNRAPEDGRTLFGVIVSTVLPVVWIVAARNRRVWLVELSVQLMVAYLFQPLVLFILFKQF